MKISRTLATPLAMLLIGTGTFAATAGPGANNGRAQVDSNGDGVISKDEVTSMQADRFAELDLNGDGEVTADEVTEHTLQQQRKRIARMAEMQIRRMDADGDGAVTEAEFSRIAEKGFDRRDTNGDGELTRDEMRRNQADRASNQQNRPRMQGAEG